MYSLHKGSNTSDVHSWRLETLQGAEVQSTSPSFLNLYVVHAVYRSLYLDVQFRVAFKIKDLLMSFISVLIRARGAMLPPLVPSELSVLV